jgi:hypothetical protein
MSKILWNGILSYWDNLKSSCNKDDTDFIILSAKPVKVESDVNYIHDNYVLELDADAYFFSKVQYGSYMESHEQLSTQVHWFEKRKALELFLQIRYDTMQKQENLRISANVDIHAQMLWDYRNEHEIFTFLWIYFICSNLKDKFTQTIFNNIHRFTNLNVINNLFENLDEMLEYYGIIIKSVKGSNRSSQHAPLGLAFNNLIKSDILLDQTILIHQIFYEMLSIKQDYFLFAINY